MAIFIKPKSLEENPPQIYRTNHLYLSIWTNNELTSESIKMITFSSMTSRYFSKALSATALTHCHIPRKESRDIKHMENKLSARMAFQISFICLIIKPTLTEFHIWKDCWIRYKRVVPDMSELNQELTCFVLEQCGVLQVSEQSMDRRPLGRMLQSTTGVHVLINFVQITYCDKCIFNTVKPHCLKLDGKKKNLRNMKGF